MYHNEKTERKKKKNLPEEEEEGLNQFKSGELSRIINPW